MRLLVVLLGAVVNWVSGEQLQNGGFESLAHWDCWSGIHCSLSQVKHSGQHGLQVTNRHSNLHGPSQFFSVTPGHVYDVSVWTKLLNDKQGQLGQTIELKLQLQSEDGSSHYLVAGAYGNAKVSDGWVHVQGSFDVPPDAHIHRGRLAIQGPDPSVNFVVDDASVTQASDSDAWREATDRVINQTRKSDLHIHVATAPDINKPHVKIHVLQTKKSFPFGVAVQGSYYNQASNQKYRDFIHQHFNWAVLANYLKWRSIERHRGQSHFQPALDVIHGVKAHGLKVRGHCLVWSDVPYLPDWVTHLSGDELRHEVKRHILETMNATHRLLEHWDVSNEALHFHWLQDRLHDPDYNLELFRIAHNADPNVELFLNDWNVVASDGSTVPYLEMAQKFQAANVGLSRLGVQCHFGDEHEPNPNLIKKRLDTVAQAGLPIWATELDAHSADENKRADYYERALRALYGHPAVEGIMLWAVWDKAYLRGQNAALIHGDNCQLTAAGRRVLDLLENQWMTDETHVLSQSGDQFTVRGFHGNYDVRVMYNGHELRNLRKTVHLGRRVLDLYESEWMTDETHVLTQSGDQFTVRGFHGDYELRVMYHGKELRSLRKTFQLGKTAVTIDLAVHT